MFRTRTLTPVTKLQLGYEHTSFFINRNHVGLLGYPKRHDQIFRVFWGRFHNISRARIPLYDFELQCGYYSSDEPKWKHSFH